MAFALGRGLVGISSGVVEANRPGTFSSLAVRDGCSEMLLSSCSQLSSWKARTSSPSSSSLRTVRLSLLFCLLPFFATFALPLALLGPALSSEDGCDTGVDEAAARASAAEAARFSAALLFFFAAAEVTGWSSSSSSSSREIFEAVRDVLARERVRAGGDARLATAAETEARARAPTGRGARVAGAAALLPVREADTISTSESDMERVRVVADRAECVHARKY